MLSGAHNLEEACRILHELGTETIVVTLGGEGTYLSSRGKTATIPSISVNPVDTTGAGDAFIGCLLYQISTLSEPHEAANDFEALSEMVNRANTAGALTTTQFGAIEALPNQEQLAAVN